MRGLVAVVLLPACLAACSQMPPPEVTQSAASQVAAPVTEAARAAFDRFAALAPQTSDPPTAGQAPFFGNIEELLLGSRKATSAWNGELFLRAAQDQFWRGALDIAVSEKLSLASTEDIAGFRGLVWARIEDVDRSNTRFLKAEVDGRGGWPPMSDVGEGGAHFAWLLAQHADRDPEFQRRVLALMEPLAATGEVYGYDFATLFDRVAVKDRRPQRFGTQGRCIEGENRWQPDPIEDPDRLDARRAAVGMGPMAEAIAKAAEDRVCEGV